MTLALQLVTTTLFVVATCLAFGLSFSHILGVLQGEEPEYEAGAWVGVYLSVFILLALLFVYIAPVIAA